MGDAESEKKIDGSTQKKSFSSWSRVLAGIALTAALLAIWYFLYYRVDVPSVKDVSLSQATAQIESASLKLGLVTNQYTAKVPIGNVVSQRPGTDAKANRGSSVNIVISSGPKGTIAINPQFSWADNFNSVGLAYVELNDSEYGYVNPTGRLVIRRKATNCDVWSTPLGSSSRDVLGVKYPDYSSAVTTSSMAFVEKIKLALAYDQKCKIGYINQRGKYVIKPEYDQAFPFDNSTGLAVVGKKVMSGSFVQYGFVNKAGHLSIPLNFTYAENFNAETGLALVQDPVSGKYGYIDKHGKFAIAPKFDEASHFNNSKLAIVGIKSGNSDIKYGYINVLGKYIIRPQFTEEFYKYDINDLNFNAKTGLALALVPTGASGNWPYKSGYINKKGKFIIPPKFECAQEFSQDTGLALVGVKASKDSFGQWDCKYGYIDSKGKFVASPNLGDYWPLDFGTFPSTFGNFTDSGLSPANTFRGNEVGYVNTKGKFLIPPQFTCAGLFDIKTSLAVVSIDKECNRVGYIDRSGSYQINPQFQEARPFDVNTGLAAVKSDGKWGYIR